jgi:hypothetical protein
VTRGGPPVRGGLPPGLGRHLRPRRLPQGRGAGGAVKLGELLRSVRRRRFPPRRRCRVDRERAFDALTNVSRPAGDAVPARADEGRPESGTAMTWMPDSYGVPAGGARVLTCAPPGAGGRPPGRRLILPAAGQPRTQTASTGGRGARGKERMNKDEVQRWLSEEAEALEREGTPIAAQVAACFRPGERSSAPPDRHRRSADTSRRWPRSARPRLPRGAAVLNSRFLAPAPVIVPPGASRARRELLAFPVLKRNGWPQLRLVPSGGRGQRRKEGHSMKRSIGLALAALLIGAAPAHATEATGVDRCDRTHWQRRQPGPVRPDRQRRTRRETGEPRRRKSRQTGRTRSRRRPGRTREHGRPGRRRENRLRDDRCDWPHWPDR